MGLLAIKIPIIHVVAVLHTSTISDSETGIIGTRNISNVSRQINEFRILNVNHWPEAIRQQHKVGGVASKDYPRRAHRGGSHLVLTNSPPTDPSVFRYGRHGTYGVFHSNTPPTVDGLGVTDTSQSYVFDLLQVA